MEDVKVVKDFKERGLSEQFLLGGRYDEIFQIERLEIRRIDELARRERTFSQNYLL